MFKNTMKITLGLFFCFCQYLFASLPVTGGLVLHLDAETLSLADGAAIGTWGDATQATAAKQPTYVASSAAFGGCAVVHFDGTDDFMALPSPAPFNVGSVTAFAVGKFMLDKSGDQYLLAGQNGGGNGRIRFAAYTGRFEYQVGNSGYGAITSSPADEDVHVFAITSTAEGFLDGVSVGTSSSNTATDVPPALNIGSYNLGAKDFFKGDIAELIIYDRVLTAQEMTDVTGYLVSRFLLNNAAPDVDAGPSYATWVDSLPQDLAGSVSDDDVALDGIAWSIISNPDGANPILTNTSTDPYAPTASFTTDMIGDYTIQLTATDGVGQSVLDNAVVSVAANACAAAQLIPNWVGFSKYDVDENCNIDLADLAAFALAWLETSSLTTPEEIIGSSVKIIAIIGDSTVCEWPTSGTTRGWGQYIQEYFLPSAAAVVNKAKSGRSTKTFIQEGLWAETLALNPDYVLIQFGHNDSHDPSYPESTDAETDYQDYLRQYIDDSRAIGAIPVLVTPMYRRVFDALGNLEDNLVPYATAMKNVAAEKSVPVIDLNAASAELYLNLGPDGCLTLASSSTDPTHFNETGARAMAELVMEQLPVVEPSLKPLLK